MGPSSTMSVSFLYPSIYSSICLSIKISLLSITILAFLGFPLPALFIKLGLELIALLKIDRVAPNAGQPLRDVICRVRIRLFALALSLRRFRADGIHILLVMVGGAVCRAVEVTARSDGARG